ncbi:alpha/beta hydrolase fold domain-containing protein [Tomitella fengzijianii]|uniref:Alpha/beta hydrolase n=1 Tax=Tomitella fengzijianii TaxID=2597660 RepID=A0A516X125_9ACTN|nr:alpha/beta hydrolase fold domain-containing protein [Tomitella fengzijianii]QDQ96717.1 alpha/beta hydrolase [Tomitella fengzijianii]
MSIDTAIVAAYLRRTRKPLYSDAERYARHLQQPKADAGPPRWLRRRCAVAEHTVEGFRLVTVAPRTGATGSVVLYLHGGAYVNEIAPQHWTLIGMLARAGATVHVPLYGLAPQHGFTEAYAMLDAVYADLADAAPALTVMGDSAGGGLTLGFAQTLRDSARPLPRALTLIAPWLDIACRNPEIDAIEAYDPWLGKAGALVAGRAWARGTDPDDPRLSPALGSMAGLPPIDAYYGTFDITYADAAALERACRDADTPLDLQVATGACHVYPLVPTRAGRAARRRIVVRATGTP